MSWEDILKNKEREIRRIKAKDERRNPRESRAIDDEPKPKEELPPPSKKPFDPFAPDAGKQARASKKLREERAKRERVDSMMDTKPSRMSQLMSDQQERYMRLKERREKGGN